ncbi:MAG: ASPIC/UnbV domain-containing protein, partial [Planctomycetota bacterium]
IDFLTSHLDRPLGLLKNTSAVSGNWIQFQLVGTDSERDAIGASLSVQAGNRTFHAWRTAGDGYLGTNESAIHIGVGNETDTVSIHVRWPNGFEQRFEGLTLNERYLVIEGSDEVFAE